MTKQVSSSPSFRDLSLDPALLTALDAVGYETPSPIQAQTIPHLMAGRDVLGQAQTGTGKTAAFALPILSRLDLEDLCTQVLVLAPTRELAIQVAEAFQRYAKHMRGFHVLPLYGGQAYGGQIRALKRGVHVIVGTPGRVMDHMRRGTLRLDSLKALVLDEADEMLRMGFIDDVEWVLERTPKARQIALFSATMPKEVRRIAQKHLQTPMEVTVKVTTTTAETIRQRFWMVSGTHKLDALTRILEAESFDGMIVFVRTKTATIELAEKLEARGFASAPLNGDIPQAQRERTIEQLKSGRIDILVATDVAARGLDVNRISHVVNYDIPYDTEAYVHRIGRTGRAGRSGDAILFVAPRERRLLRAIEKATRKSIEKMDLPSAETINDKRIARFNQRITDTLAEEELGFFYQLLERYQQEHNVPALELAAALAKLLQGDTPLLVTKPQQPVATRASSKPAGIKPKTSAAPRRDGKRDNFKVPKKQREGQKRTKLGSKVDTGMERFRIEVGDVHGASAAKILGAIANETGLDSFYVGRIDIKDTYSTVDLPEGMPREMFRALKKVWVAGQQLKITRFDAGGQRSKPVKSRGNKQEKVRPSKRREQKAA